MDDTIQPLLLCLRQNGYSATLPRRHVFEALLNQEAISMNELISRLPEIDRASIYRTIELFLRLGIVERIQIGWKYKIELSAAYSHHHHHMTCISCGEVLSFEENHDLERVLDDIASHSTFRPTSHQIEIRGYCKNCQIKK